jgi:hypothetical protein
MTLSHSNFELRIVNVTFVSRNLERKHRKQLQDVPLVVHFGMTVNDYKAANRNVYLRQFL